MEKSLKEIALEHNVDKVTKHNYITEYEYHFEPVRDRNICLFEIGIDQGRSIKMWRDYFPEAVIVGIDIKENSLQYYGDRVYTIVANQRNVEDLKHIVEIFPSFDFIIDDGSHKSYDQVFSFLYLFEHLKSGGVYFIEDTHTSFIRQFTRSKYREKTCYEYFVKLSESMNRKSGCLIPSIQGITFTERMIVIRKKKFEDLIKPVGAK